MNKITEKLKETISYMSLFFNAENEYTTELMQKNPYKIQDLINPSKELQIAAIQTDPSVIQFISNPSEKIQLLAITINPSTIRYISNPTKDVQLTAVKISPSVIQHIKAPSKDIILAAIERDFSVIKTIPNPSEELQLIAIKKNPEAIQYIKHPTIEAQLEVIHTSQNKKLIEKVEMDMVKENPGVIAILPNPSEAVQLEAVKADLFVIGKIKEPSKQVQLTAIQKSIYSIQNIPNPTPKVLFQAIKLSSNDPFFINILPESLQITAVQTKPNLFSLITDPSPAVHKAIIENICNIKIHSNVDNGFIPKVRSLLYQLDSIQCRHSEMLLKADYSDDPQQTKKEQDEADRWKATETSKAITSFKEDIKNDYPFIERKTEDLFSCPQTDSTNKEVIGTISYYGFNGEVREVIEYDNAESYLKAIEHELDCNPTGFRYKTLTTNPEVKKAVDDLTYDIYDMNNPHPLEWYSSNNTKAVINPDQYLSEERNKIMREYAKNPWGALDKENVSAEGMDKWAAVTNKYIEMKTNITTNQAELQSSGSKSLIGDISNYSDREQINNYRILDKSTGKVEPLNVENIDLGKQPPEALKKLLSGQQTEITSKSGITQMMGLSKSPAGWTLQAGKQIFNMADSSAEI